MTTDQELGLAIDAELKRIGLDCLPSVYWPYDNPGVVLRFVTEVDRQTFGALVESWLFIVMTDPNHILVGVTSSSLPHVLEQLKAALAVA